MSIHPAGRGRVPARPARGRRRDRARRHRPALHPHAGAPARALLPRGQRPHARAGAVDRPHRRLALRRRRRATRSRGRGRGGRRGALPLAPAARRARGRRRGVSRARRRLALRQGDELEGVDDDRLRAPLQPGARARRRRALRRRVGRISAPRPPNMERIVELNRGPFVGAQPEPQELAAPLARRRSSTSVRRGLRAGHLAGALSVPVSGTRFATKAAFVLDPAPVVVSPRTRTRRPSAVRGLRSVGCSTSPGYVLGGGAETLELVSVDELDELLEQGAELIDVREKDERDTGYIAGSRNIPYRLLALGEADLPRDRPIVTICETGPRAAIAASILSAHGFDAPGRRRRHRRVGRGRQADGRVQALRQLTQLRGEQRLGVANERTGTDLPVERESRRSCAAASARRPSAAEPGQLAAARRPRACARRCARGSRRLVELDQRRSRADTSVHGVPEPTRRLRRRGGSRPRSWQSEAAPTTIDPTARSEAPQLVDQARAHAPRLRFASATRAATTSAGSSACGSRIAALAARRCLHPRRPLDRRPAPCESRLECRRPTAACSASRRRSRSSPAQRLVPRAAEVTSSRRGCPGTSGAPSGEPHPLARRAPRA